MASVSLSSILASLPTIPAWLSTSCLIGSLGILYLARKSQPLNLPTEIIQFSTNDDFKMVLLIRTDLNMQKGKVAAQCSHATLAAYKQALRINPGFLQVWERNGQAKITLKVNSEDELLDLVIRAKQKGLPSSIIQDAGRTQVTPGSKTVGAIGPGPVSVIDGITGHLKLY